MIRRYRDIRSMTTLEDRFNYLKLHGIVNDRTFGGYRYLNQLLYRSKRWKQAWDAVIIRDNGCDLGIEGYPIYKKLIVHHMNPITIEDIENDNPDIYDPEFLICVSELTHNAIHYGSASLLPKLPTVRYPGDTSIWKGEPRDGQYTQHHEEIARPGW